MLKKTKLLLPLLLLPSCSLYIQGVLDEAAVNVVAEGEGEGREGEGEEGEGEEGEGEEGEGEIPDTDPACEDEERLLVIRDSSTDSIQVYEHVPNRFLLLRPEGQAGAVNIDNDNPNAINNGYGADAAALGSDGRLYVVGGNFIYQFDAATMTQENITGRVMATQGGSSYSVQVIANTIVTSGDSIFTLREGAAADAVPTEVPGQNDDYHRSIKFGVGDEEFVAVNARFGFVLLSSRNNEPPTTTIVYDEDFAEDRFHEYGGGTFFPRGIAFDPATRKLLLGDPGRVIVLRHDNGFSVAANDRENDYVLPAESESLVVAIAARGGFAYVLLERSVDNLIKLDLSQEPPVAVDIATVNTGIGRGDTMAVGCRRLIIGSQTGIFGVDRETLEEFTSNGIGDVQHVQVVSRTALGLAGDD